MSKSSKNKPVDVSGLSFEQALEQVESIIERIEQGEVGLEESLAEYERGVLLIQHCRRVHKDAVQRVDDLTARLMADGGKGGPASPGEGAGGGGDGGGGGGGIEEDADA